MMKINVQDLKLIDLKTKKLSDYGLSDKLSYLIVGSTPENRRSLMEMIIKNHDITNHPRILAFITGEMVYHLWKLNKLLSPGPKERSLGLTDPQGDITKIRSIGFPNELIDHGIFHLGEELFHKDIWIEEFGFYKWTKELQKYYGIGDYPEGLYGVGEHSEKSNFFITSGLTLSEINDLYFELDEDIKNRFEIIELTEEEEYKFKGFYE